MSGVVLAAEDEGRPAFTMRMLYAPLVAPSMQNGVMVAHHALDKINLEVSKARRDGPLLACTGYHKAFSACHALISSARRSQPANRHCLSMWLGGGICSTSWPCRRRPCHQ